MRDLIIALATVFIWVVFILVIIGSSHKRERECADTCHPKAAEYINDICYCGLNGGWYPSNISRR